MTLARLAFIEPHSVWLTLIGDDDVQVTITINVTRRQPHTGCSTKRLTRIGEDPGPVVQPAVDGGLVVDGITDGFADDGPDLGTIEGQNQSQVGANIKEPGVYDDTCAPAYLPSSGDEDRVDDNPDPGSQQINDQPDGQPDENSPLPRALMLAGATGILVLAGVLIRRQGRGPRHRE